MTIAVDMGRKATKTNKNVSNSSIIIEDSFFTLLLLDDFERSMRLREHDD